MTATEIRELIGDAIYTECELRGDACELHNVSSFEEAGMLTRDEGLVLTMADGSKFQVTIIQR